ncbi:hypothetical protein Calag_0259 [Caldisphaera lagunensis DSM 15908]|uniref:Uncharacterized protein n=1 Tax=Caldisphaera lagunensis (strain DSM 15908 / JCM 11604 / ANMR 0165 / IC-154) TaxID=1056495 RepID=L0AAH0_CALLD|nr:hypothetical protein [Caldisphaera lagunensis]AFZ70040.1 hypothetical protein Calag_0259 [Caldisphaera lagunensis DSM 15908]
MDSKLIGVTVVAVILLIAAAGLGYMYSATSSSYNSLKSQYNQISQNLTNTNNKLNELSSELSSINSSYNSLSSSYKKLALQFNGQQPQVVLALAMSHWNDIAIENASLVIQEYAPNAVLHWIGGPLAGTYNGVSQITNVWNKFFNTYETVYWYTIIPPSVTQINSTTYQVTGYAQFFVAPTSDPLNLLVLNVTEMLTYQYINGQYMLTNEVWKVMPLTLSDVIAGYPSQEYIQSQLVLALAMSHWNDIAIENASLVIQEYAPNAVLHWIGGPLTGNYTGIEQINATWNKFNSLYEYVTWYSLVPPSVVIHGTSAMAYAPLQFVVFPFPTSSNPTPHELVLNVTEELYYNYNTSTSSWQIVNEYWIVHPIPVSDVAPGYTGSVYNASS